MQLPLSTRRATKSFGAEKIRVDAILLEISPCFLVVHGKSEHYSASNELAPKWGVFLFQRRQIVGVGCLNDFGAQFGAERIGCLDVSDKISRHTPCAVRETVIRRGIG